MTKEETGAVLLNHLETGEPLDTPEVAAVCAFGYARPDDFENVGAGLWSAVALPVDD